MYTYFTTHHDVQQSISHSITIGNNINVDVQHTASQALLLDVDYKNNDEHILYTPIHPT